MRIPSALLKEFIASLSGKAGTTVDAYHRELRHFLDWISQRAGNSSPFNAQQHLTKTALQTYLTHLQSEGHSVSSLILLPSSSLLAAGKLVINIAALLNSAPVGKLKFLFLIRLRGEFIRLVILSSEEQIEWFLEFPRYVVFDLNVRAVRLARGRCGGSAP
jgi:hypothetical protein